MNPYLGIGLEFLPVVAEAVVARMAAGLGVGEVSKADHQVGQVPLKGEERQSS